MNAKTDTKTVTISRERYETLVAAKEDLEDILAFDRAMADDREGLPHAFMLRLIAGENPLAVFRAWRGLGQTDLAKRSGVNRVQIIDIESGRKTGSVATLKKLADALGISIDDLV